jgi:dTDP-4-amino-4,6-dideoxygalactose transaminase
MLNGPFSPWPSFMQEEADAVYRVLLSNKVNYWTGQEGREFEKEFAAFAGTDYAIAVGNGTLALDLALKGLGIGPGDEVVVTPRTFLASATAVINAGATPVFADVDPETQNITPATVAAVLTPKTRAVVCVHLAGWPCDMDGMMALAVGHNLFVIEDCAQAHGATYKGKPVGGLGHVGCWSFCQDKIMSTGGEGGMVTVNDRDLWSNMWSFKDHGKSWNAVYEREHQPGFRWLHESVGTNWRLTEMQSTIGRIQLQRMPEWTAARQAHCRAIWETAASLPGFSVPVVPEDIGHAGYKCYVFVDEAVVGPSAVAEVRDRIMNAIVAEGVPCFSGSCSEVYLEKAFTDLGLGPQERLPVAKALGESALMFLVHPTLTEAEIDKTCEVLRKVMGSDVGLRPSAYTT